ncbi:MAG: hypothetical protein LBV74_18385 [Tannerella sp.]|jgi:hypothetical protein|nr:hypothetical protein [Tannerella sp.]
MAKLDKINQVPFCSRPLLQMDIKIKATGSVCHLNCSDYTCLSKEQSLNNGYHRHISDKTFKNFIKQYIEQQNAHALLMECRESQYLFAHAGEYSKNRLLKTSSGELGLNN